MQFLWLTKTKVSVYCNWKIYKRYPC